MSVRDLNKPARHPAYEANRDTLLALFPLCLMAAFLYGLRPVVLLAAAAVTARLCDRLAARLRGLPRDTAEDSSVVHAVILTLLLPAAVPYRVLILAVAVSVFVGKHVFGGWDQTPFHPAALGYVVAAVSWPEQVSRYTAPFAPLGLSNAAAQAAGKTTAHVLSETGLPNIASLDLWLGSWAGPMGATCTLVILAVAVFLLVRRRISAEPALAFLAVCALMSLVYPRVVLAGRLEVLEYELLSGAVLFGSVFLVCDPVTAPKTRRARIVYGLLCGFVTMMYRYYGSYELGICFAVLLVNAFSGTLDRLCSRPGRVWKRRVSEQ